MTHPRERSPGTRGLLTPANLPWMGLLLVGFVALGAFVVFSGGDGDPPPTSGTTTIVSTTTSAATTTTEATTTTTAPLDDDSPAPFAGLAFEPLVEGLSFPVYATAPPGDERTFIVQRNGLVAVVDHEDEVLAALDTASA